MAKTSSELLDVAHFFPTLASGMVDVLLGAVGVRAGAIEPVPTTANEERNSHAELTRVVLQKHGKLWFLNQSLVIWRHRFERRAANSSHS